MLRINAHTHPISSLMRGIVIRTDNVLLRCSHCGRLRLAPDSWDNVQPPTGADIVMVVCPDCAEALSTSYRLNPPTDDKRHKDLD